MFSLGKWNTPGRLSFSANLLEIRYGSLIIKVRDDQACDPRMLLISYLTHLPMHIRIPNSIVHIKQMFVEKPVTYEDFHLLQAAKIPENSFIRSTVLEILSSQSSLFRLLDSKFCQL